MAISVVSSTAVGANNPLSGNFALPGSWAQNDLALFWWYARINTKTFTDASGGNITVLHNSVVAQGTLVIGYRVLQSSDVATNMDWTSGTVTNASVAYGTLILRGADITTPIEAESGTPTSINNTQSPNPPSVVVATTGACVVTIFGKNNDYTTITAPASYTLGGAAEDTLGTDGSGGLAYRLNVSAGTEDPAAWTLGGLSSDDGRAWTCSIRPLAGAALAASVSVAIGPVTAALTTEIRLAAGITLALAAVADRLVSVGFGTSNFGTYPFGFGDPAAAGPILLAGTATLAVTTTGALTSEIRLVAASTLYITTAGVLTTTISLAATPALTLTAAGQLTSEIRLAGTATLAVTSSANLLAPVDAASDDFNRADEDPLLDPWVPAPGSASGLVLTGNGVSATGGDGQRLAYHGGVTPDADQYAEVTMTTVAGSAIGGPAVRISDTGGTLNDYHAFPLGGTHYILARWVAGSYLELASYPTTPVAGDVLRLEASGTTVRVLLNGTQLMIVTGETAHTTGRVGLHIYTGAPSGPTLDDWSGGTLVEAAMVAAAATVQVTTTAGLTTVIALAAAPTLAVTTTGQLTSEIRLAGAATLAIATAAPLITEIPLEAVAALAITTSAALTTELWLAAGASVAVTTTAALLAPGSSLSAEVVLRVTTAGALTNEIHLAGTATLALTTLAPLTTEISLGGSGALAVTTTAALTAGIGLAGTATVQITATGDLATPTGLAAETTVRITTSAALTTTILVGAAPTLRVTATAALTTGLGLAGAATLAITTAANLTAEAPPMAGAATLRLLTAADLATAISLAGTALLAIDVSGTIGEVPPSIENPGIRLLGRGRSVRALAGSRGVGTDDARRGVRALENGNRTVTPITTTHRTVEHGHAD